MVQNGVDPTSVEGANNLPYAIANQTVGLTTTDVRVPVLWWRPSARHTPHSQPKLFWTRLPRLRDGIRSSSDCRC